MTHFDISSSWIERVDALWAAFDDMMPAAFLAAMDELTAGLPADHPRALFELASANDSVGNEAEAAPLYEAALAGGLDRDLRRQATIQLASTLRNLGRPEDGLALLRDERKRGSNDLGTALAAFEALLLADLKREREGLGIALTALAAHLPRYRRSVANYAAALLPFSDDDLAVFARDGAAMNGTSHDRPHPASTEFVWSGKTEMQLEGPSVQQVGHVVVGLHGGNGDHGACKNEDGALLWLGEDWVFAVVLDAHNTAASAELVLDLFAQSRPRLEAICDSGRPGDFRALERAITDMLMAPSARERLADVRGETACLVCFQRGQYVMWMSIGDNSLYLLHPELARVGQYALTTRNYFEWIGARNSMALDVPCFSSGVRELRSGTTTIALVTDGILEFGDRPFEHPAAFAQAMLAPTDLPTAVARLLAQAHQGGATDSTTILAWRVDSVRPALLPTG